MVTSAYPSLISLCVSSFFAAFPNDTLDVPSDDAISLCFSLMVELACFVALASDSKSRANCWSSGNLRMALSSSNSICERIKLADSKAARISGFCLHTVKNAELSSRYTSDSPTRLMSWVLGSAVKTVNSPNVSPGPSIPALINRPSTPFTPTFT